MSRPTKTGDRPRAHPLADVFGRELAKRRDQALGQQQHRRARTHLVGNRTDGLRQRAGGDRQADQVEAGELDFGGLAHANRVGQADALQVATVFARLLNLGGVSSAAGSELDLKAAAGEQDGDRGAPAAGPDHGGTAHRWQAAEVLPLQLDVGPDPRGDGGREPAGGVPGPREGQRLAQPDLDFTGADAPAAAHVFGAEHRGRNHRGTGLQRQPPDPALGLTQGAAADAGALGEDADRATAFDQQPRRLHRVLVGLAATDREGAEARAYPALPAALEALDLGDVVQRPPPGQGSADREGVEEAAVVGGDNQATLEPGVLATGADVAEIDQEEGGHEDPGEDVQDRIDAVLAGVVVVRLEAVRGHA